MKNHVLSTGVLYLKKNKNSTAELIIETSESFFINNPDVFKIENKGVCFYIVEGDKIAEDIPEIIANSGIQPDEKPKTPSQKLRSVLYVNWNENFRGVMDFQSYYESYISEVIQDVSREIDKKRL